MPQLFPMNWMLMTLLFFTLLIFTSTLLFFSPMTSMKVNFFKKSKTSMLMKW
uniref:ATPase subunit 8 n=1 Tax=Ixodes uriae TaxID=59655 RepID=Q6F6D1_IXOUR|nr:ATP synthase F0 subunit 8 [Ixodes uriae]BAD27244.1 ATPase subunit 8 [Ixodes uriae]